MAKRSYLNRQEVEGKARHSLNSITLNGKDDLSAIAALPIEMIKQETLVIPFKRAGANLQGSQFSHGHLEKAELTNCNLKQANFPYKLLCLLQ